MEARGVTGDVIRDFPSPVLPQEQVRQLLTEGLAEVGAAGGAIGGSVRGPLAAAGGASGGATGARLGARLFTKVTGQARTLPVPVSPTAYRVAHDSLWSVVSAAEPGPAGGVLVGFFPAGMNPVLVQLVWRPSSVDVTAHALEGLIKQRTALKALDGMAKVLGPYARAG